MPDLKIGDTVSLTVEKYDPSRDSAPRLETYEVPYTKQMRVLGSPRLRGRGARREPFLPVVLRRQEVRHVRGDGQRAPDPRVLGTSRAPDGRTAARGFSGRAGPGHRSITVLRERSVARALDAARATLWRLSRSNDRDRAGGSGRHHALHRVHAVRFGLSRERRAVHGTAPMVQLARFALDPRDGADRAATALAPGGIEHCVGCRQCTHVCPAGIRVFEGAIEGLNRQARESGRSDRSRGGRSSSPASTTSQGSRADSLRW